MPYSSFQRSQKQLKRIQTAVNLSKLARNKVTVETFWIPLFKITNRYGLTAIPQETLDTPIEISRNPDGTVRFSRTGLPIRKVNKDISKNIKLVKRNFVKSYPSLNFEKFCQTLSPEINQAIDKSEISPELAQKIHNLLITHNKSVEPHILPGSFEMGKHR